MLQVTTVFGAGNLGRELSVQLAHRALQNLTADPVAAWLWATPEYDLADAINALHVLLGDVPVWGSTVRRVWHNGSVPARGMSMVVLAGEGVRAEGRRWPSLPATQTFADDVGQMPADAALVVIDAMQPRLDRWLTLLQALRMPVAGGLIGGGLQAGRPTLLGGREGGAGGLALLTLQGVQMGLGAATGWRSSGLWATVTESRGEWLRTLDDRPVTDVLAEIFAQPARQWPYAPWRELVRLYPLGLRREDRWDLRAPLHVEADGSLRMTLPLPRGERVYWMVGEMSDALAAVETAAQSALQALTAPPAVAFVTLDWAWYYLFLAHHDQIAQRLRQVLGEKVPLVGIYTYGQWASTGEGVALLHNHVLVSLLAQA